VPIPLGASDDEEAELIESAEIKRLQAMTDEEFRKTRFSKFALKAIYKKPELEKRLREIQQSFYNRLESSKLIKKYGKIPFTEHMTVTHKNPVLIPENAQALEINDDIKRELAFYNIARDNVKTAMSVCVQAKVPIERPDDFFAEMIKTDAQMAKIKSRLMKQTHKITKYEEKKGKMENKKFHKAIKQFTQQKRHQEKKDNMAAIGVLKDQIKSGANVGDKEFNSIMMKSGSQMGLDPKKGEKTKNKSSVIGQIKGQKPVAPKSDMPNFAKAKKGEKGRLG